MAGFTEESAREAFTVVDTDGDGQITPGELRHLWERLGETLEDVELERIFTKADADGDGLISVDEFVTLLVPGGEEAEA